MVDQETGGHGDRPEYSPEDPTSVIHELAEALTAIGNYVAAAAQISGGADPIGTDVHKVLEEVACQQERAATALHQLRRLVTRRKRSI